MNCRECQRDMSQCLDGRLPSGRRTAVIQHLENCQRCNQLWGEFQRAQELVIRLPAREVSPDFHQRLWERIKAGEGSPEAVFSEPMPLLTKARYVFTGATAAALFLVMLNSWSSGTGPDSFGTESELVSQLTTATALSEPLPFVPQVLATEVGKKVVREYGILTRSVRRLEQLPSDRLDEPTLRIIRDSAGAMKSMTQILLWLQRNQHVELPTDMIVTLNLVASTLDVNKLRSTGQAHELRAILSPVVLRQKSLERLVREMRVRAMYRQDEQIEFERRASEFFREQRELLKYVDIQLTRRSPRFPSLELKDNNRNRGLTPVGPRQSLFILLTPHSSK